MAPRIRLSSPTSALRPGSCVSSAGLLRRSRRRRRRSDVLSSRYASSRNDSVARANKSTSLSKSCSSARTGILAEIDPGDPLALAVVQKPTPGGGRFARNSEPRSRHQRVACTSALALRHTGHCIRV